MTLITILASQRQLFFQHKKGIMLVIYTLFFVGYLGLGSLLFLLIEGPQIESEQQNVLNARIKILNNYPGVPVEALDDFMDELRSLGTRGLPARNNTINKWSFADAAFFSTTLLTTIGYGHVTPKTPLGKVICLIYTGLGIPLMLLLLASYVDRLMKLSESYKAALFHKSQNLIKPFYIRLTHMTTIMVSIVLFCFIFPAMIFATFENGWSFFDSIYFCFISLTTVGLGDFVPAMNNDLPFIYAYKYGSIIYLIAGVTIMMFMMAMVADFQQNYNSCYTDTLPFTMPSEKIPINTAKSESYGSIYVSSQKISEEDENNRILQP